MNWSRWVSQNVCLLLDWKLGVMNSRSSGKHAWVGQMKSILSQMLAIVSDLQRFLVDFCGAILYT